MVIDVSPSWGEPSASNPTLSNSIGFNGGLGIDLSGGTQNAFGVTVNDEDDSDTGPNYLQNYPVLTSATRDSTTGVTTIRGTPNSNPSPSFTIQCFKADGDASDHGEGLKFLAETTTTADADGDSTFTCTTGALAVGEEVSATATSRTTFGPYDTSEFSENVVGS